MDFFCSMYSTFKGKIKVKDLTNDFMRKIQYDASYPTYKVSNSTIINQGKLLFESKLALLVGLQAVIRCFFLGFFQEL